MDVAFIENTKHDVDGDNSGQDQHRFRRERILKNLRCSLETAPDRVWHMNIAGGLLNDLCRLQERSVGIQIERECDRRELALMIYRSRSIGGLNVCDGAERNLD